MEVLFAIAAVGAVVLILSRTMPALASPVALGGTGTLGGPSGGGGGTVVVPVCAPGQLPCALPYCVPIPGGCLSITSDPATWPSGDRIWDICQAIAWAEGANVAGSVPDRYNNPGDLSHGDAPQFSTVTVPDGEVLVMFPDKLTGWNTLRAKWVNIMAGNSGVYDPGTSWLTIGRSWAGNSLTWANNVTNRLGVSVDSTPNQYVGDSCCSCGCTCMGGG